MCLESIFADVVGIQTLELRLMFDARKLLDEATSSDDNFDNRRQEQGLEINEWQHSSLPRQVVNPKC